MSYLYVANNDTSNRFDQITIEGDSGALILLRKGHVYDLSPTEVAKARNFVVLVDSSQAPDPIDSGGSASGGGVIVTPPSSPAPSVVNYKAWIERLI